MKPRKTIATIATAPAQSVTDTIDASKTTIAASECVTLTGSTYTRPPAS